MPEGKVISPPDVLHIIHGFWVGGAERDLVGKLRCLGRQHGYQLTVCCLMRRGSLAAELEAEGARILGPDMRHRHDPNGVASLRRLLVSKPWDLIHSHMYEASLLTGVTLTTLLPQRRPRWIVSEHAMADYWDRIPLFLLRRIAQESTAFVVPTRTASESYIAQGFPRHRLRVIPNGVALDVPADRSQARTRLRASLGISDNEVLLGTVCRLHEVKALPILFEAAAPLPVRVLIAGDGPARPELETLLVARGWNDRMQLLGTRPDVSDFLAALDVFVLSSLSESMSIAVAEALLAGVPVVATRTGGIPEITGDGRYARLVSPGDVAALRDGILATLQNLPDATRAALMGRAWVTEHLSVDAGAKRLHELYSELRDR